MSKFVKYLSYDCVYNRDNQCKELEEIWSIRSNTLFDQIRDQWCRFKLALHPLNPQLISKVSFTRRLLRWRIAMTRWRPYYLIYQVLRDVSRVCVDLSKSKDLSLAILRGTRDQLSLLFLFSPLVSIALELVSDKSLSRVPVIGDNERYFKIWNMYIFLLFKCLFTFDFSKSKIKISISYYFSAKFILMRI